MEWGSNPATGYDIRKNDTVVLRQLVNYHDDSGKGDIWLSPSHSMYRVRMQNIIVWGGC